MLRPCLTCLLVLLAACSPRPAQEGPLPPPVVLHGVRLRAYEGSTLSATGHAAQLAYERSAGQATASQATLRFPRHAPSGAPLPGVEIRAPLMQGALSERQLLASGGVQLRSSDGVVAHTPSATYDAAARVAHGSQGVLVQGPGWALQADAFSLSLTDEALSCEGSVHAVLGAAR